MANKPIRIEVSALHIHLAAADLVKLFGEGYVLTPKRALSQPGQYLAEERLRVEGPKGAFDSVAVLGPVREETQVELARSDACHLGLEAPLRLSGDIAGSAGVRLIGPKGAVALAQGAIVARRHIHLSPEDAARLGLADGQDVCVRAGAERAVVFEQVAVRVDTAYKSAMHIDTDEADAAGLAGESTGEILPE